LNKRRFPIKVADSALSKLSESIRQGGQGVKGIRIKLKSRGCSGLTYDMEYVYDIESSDAHESISGVDLFISKSSVMFLIGSTMKYENGLIYSGFTFENPNSKGECGCGESFHI
jgi:iron-sulfur cluster assembly protein